MKIIKIATTLLALTFLLIIGCSDDDTVTRPEEPAFAEGITDSNGEVELDFSSHLITVTAHDFMPQAASGIRVKGYLFNDYVYIFAVGDDTYYSNHVLVPYSEFSDDDIGAWSAGKPTTPTEVVGEIEIVLDRITSEVYTYTNDPEYQEDILTDDWSTVSSFTGTTADIFALVDSIALERNIIVNISSSVANQTNSDANTISMVLDTSVVTSDTVFSVLLGLQFHIFDSDSLTFSYVALEDSILPVVFIRDAELGDGSFFYQFTLTWGELPEDLDSHLWTPEIEGSSYHVYYVNKGSVATAPYAFLDVDDVTSWGPEHIIIQQPFPGIYYYSVHHFNGESTIPVSGTRVTLLKPDRTIQEFEPPNVVDTGVGWYWHVCSINGTTGVVTEIGTMNTSLPTVTLDVAPMPAK